MEILVLSERWRDCVGRCNDLRSGSVSLPQGRAVIVSSIEMILRQSKRNVRPCYEQYLDCDGDEISDSELQWYGEGGEIIASYDIERKLLTLGA